MSRRPKKAIEKGMLLRVLQIMWQHASHYPWTLIGLFTAVVLLILSQVLTPIFYKRLIDAAIVATSPTAEVVHGLLVILSYIAAIKGLAWISRRLRGVCMVRFESRVMADLAM